MTPLHPVYLPSPVNALLCACVAMLLTVANASPQLHGWLHDREAMAGVHPDRRQDHHGGGEHDGSHDSNPSDLAHSALPPR